MLEAAVVIDTTGTPIHWHSPAGRSVVSLPDSRSLWGVMWEHRDRLAGIAHTHPGSGTPVPSWEDLTTFSGCEAGLGLRLDWWIATADQIRLFRFVGPDPYRYRGHPLVEPPSWLPALRTLSNPISNPTSNDGAHHAV